VCPLEETLHLDPYSTEVRYTLDFMMYCLQALQPNSVRIASLSVEVVKAAVRRLCYEQVCLLVENSEIQKAIRDDLGVETNVFDRRSARGDVAIFPFSLDEGLRPAGEPAVVAACENALSYKSILYPKSTRQTIFRQMSALRSAYRLRPIAGLYSPQCMLQWAIAKGVERLSSAWWFRWADRSMDHLIGFGPLWRLSYIVVLVGRTEE
jgi:hypothetical protein